MAQNPPTSVDVQDIQFKLHDKFSIFPSNSDLKSVVSLLAVSSTKGLLFAGNPNAKELKVIKLKDIVDCKSTGQDLKARTVTLPGDPKAIACSCDGSLLAVNFILNNTGVLQIFQVDSFLTPKIISLYNVPISPQSNVVALQLLWNPVIANNIALILNDGSVTVFTLNPSGQYEMFSLGKELQVKSGCWSPKGKQIVFGFAEGKLQQFKPNLQPARAIPCPPGIHPGPFDCIALHWLSTYQFAAVFLQRGVDMCPSLFIVNAPKAGNSSYINYYDICYSAPGPRMQQLTFNHIAPWNLLLVSSANGVEVGVLGTKETGENPTWIQYTLLDEARIEMPLNDAKDETYPIGFAFDTASSHHVLMGEQELPVMPMIHVLSTHGYLVSFNFLNLSPNTVDVCSPPPPLNDNSGQFKSIKETLTQKPTGTENKQMTNPQAAPQAAAALNDMTFTLGSNLVTSTPAIKEKPSPMFGSLASGTTKPSTGFGFAAASTAASSIKPTSTGFGYGGMNTAESTAPTIVSSSSAATAGFGNKAMPSTFAGFGSGSTGFAAAKLPENTMNLVQPISLAPETSNRPTAIDVNKPLYTVPSTFKPPAVVQPSKPSAVAPKPKTNMGGDVNTDEVIKQLLAIQIDAFENELKQIKQQSKKLMENIGKPEEVKSYTKQLNDLQEIIEQANDHEFEQDVQSLRHSMNESYAMLAECRSKLDMYNNPNLTRLTALPSADPTNRRQLTKLQSLATINQTQLNQLNLLLDAQWSQYQDVVRRNTKNHMHIPCLDGIYQRMSKLKDLLGRQRTKLNHIKSKLKQKGISYKPPADADVTTVAVGALTKNQSTIESLADTILSLSLSQVVSQTHAKLSQEKLQAIRNFTRQQKQITIIKPKRPDRVDLRSEVILETKLRNERKQKEQDRQLDLPADQKSMASIMQQKQMSQPTMQYSQMTKSSLPQQQSMGMQKPQQQPLLAKPTASKPALLPNATFITPTSSTSPGLTFGSSSSFVKTSAAPSLNAASKFEDSSRPLAASTPFPAFGGSSGGLGFGQPKPLTIQKSDSKDNMPANTPISFSAKVIGGNDNKPMGAGSAGNKPPNAAPDQGFTTFKPPNVTDFSAKENSNAEQMPKTFSFGGITGNLPTSSTSSVGSNAAAPLAFSGFGAISKSSATSSAVSSSSGGGVFSSAMFGSSTMPTSFTALSSATTSATPFGTLTNFSFNTAANAATSTTTATAAIGAPKTAALSTTNASEKALLATPVSTSGGTEPNKNVSNVDSTTNPIVKSNPPPNVVVGSKTVSEAKPATSESMPTNPPTNTTLATDPTDNLIGTLNICKPDGKQEGGEATKTPSNIFSGFGAATSKSSAIAPFSFASASGADDGAQSVFSSPSTLTTPSGFSFLGSNTTTNKMLEKSDATASSKTKTTAKEAESLVSGTISTASSPVSSTTSSTAGATTPASTPSTNFSFGTSTAPAGFGAMSLTNATAASTAPIVATKATPAATAAGNMFGGNSAPSIFSQSSAISTAATSGTTSIFGSTGGLNLMASTASVGTPLTTPAPTSMFGAASAAATVPSSPPAGNIFGGVPKPDQSVFGAAPNATTPAGTGLFAAAAAATKPAATAAGGSVFSGTGFGAPAPATATGSIFGSSSANTTSPFVAPSNNAGSMFGGGAAANKPAEGGNIFGSPTQQSATSGGSLFGKSTFGHPAATSPQSGGSIFGGAAAQPSSGGFGSSTGSIFGGGSASSNPASGGSIFGAAAAATAPVFGSTSPGFSSFSQPSGGNAFASPGGGFGATAPGGAFSSPQQQSAFAKPLFGSPATFGSPPAFGAQPTFGGAATFGSPKGFGTFGATSPAAGGFGAAASPNAGVAPKGNIFDTLGSTDSGLSFGNLANTTQQPAQQKPTFGGSSFMSYRS